MKYYKNDRTKERVQYMLVGFILLTRSQQIFKQQTGWVLKLSRIINISHSKDSSKEHIGSKENVIDSAELLLREMLPYAWKAIEYYKEYQSKSISTEEFIKYIMHHRPEVNQLYMKAGICQFYPPSAKILAKNVKTSTLLSITYICM
ncbi:hypothetical protein ERICI_04291 [Paenibacillus larvae subsp. larvae]|uniref:Uncharacterized protein n=2 Tax=Paenibacillus larvae subsp. larvae TaxID=147375 RepID=V9W1Z6_9BACL|nr:hypothetical protein ERIC2_c02680 [Paenibacillus larvae subsp. larvae DSM 25430]AQR78946.1 hypothetical protein BXP28_18495 [Paenibacillus larvae subsp. larvae]ETK29337.1 hypothetical protein ERIC1_1c28790 [Paenibacillus larvae subsp. larvae DSM 25719]AVF23987.1 hypothetical protein ERICI_04291 [Paenibacillus larvae subsp. larvae]AVG10746.1 hypothetical protein ERICII_00281 [Paenibacillus larvae subsp. larvae DSM 25430]